MNENTITLSKKIYWLDILVSLGLFVVVSALSWYYVIHVPNVEFEAREQKQIQVVANYNAETVARLADVELALSEYFDEFKKYPGIDGGTQKERWDKLIAELSKISSQRQFATDEYSSREIDYVISPDGLGYVLMARISKSSPEALNALGSLDKPNVVKGFVYGVDCDIPNYCVGVITSDDFTKSYKNEAHGYSIEYPASWTVRDFDERSCCLRLTDYKTDTGYISDNPSAVTIDISVVRTYEGYSFEDYSREPRGNMVNITKVEPIQINGKNGLVSFNELGMRSYVWPTSETHGLEIMVYTKNLSETSEKQIEALIGSLTF